MITENLSTLKIHKLTKAQYDRELAAGNIDANALYLTPDEETDLSIYATTEQLATKANINHSHPSSEITDLQSKLDVLSEESKSYTDNAVAVKADKTLVVHSNYDDNYDNNNLVSDYSSSEIIAHIRNGGSTVLDDVDLGTLSFLHCFSGSVYYGGILSYNDMYLSCIYQINGNTVTIKSINFSDFAKSSDVYTKTEIENVLVSFSENYETKTDASSKLTEAKEYTAQEINNISDNFEALIYAMYDNGNDLTDNEEITTIREIANDEANTALVSAKSYTDEAITQKTQVQIIRLEAGD